MRRSWSGGRCRHAKRARTGFAVGAADGSRGDPQARVGSRRGARPARHHGFADAPQQDVFVAKTLIAATA